MVVANIFGRVALSVLVFLLIGDTTPRYDACLQATSSRRELVEGVLGGLGLQLLFSCISRWHLSDSKDGLLKACES